MTEALFADRLRFLRNERNISAREMSLALGQNESYINKIETCQRSISMSSFFKICDFFDITPAAFFNEDKKSAGYYAKYNTEKLIDLFNKLPEKRADHIYTIMQDLLE